MLRNREKEKHVEDIHNKNNEIDQEFQSTFNRGISLYRPLKKSIPNNPYMLYKKIYAEDNQLGISVRDRK